jgi:LCP family protein required for cell wall assembly
MKKIIAFIVLLLLFLCAANVILWGEHFVNTASLASSGGRTNILLLGIGGGNHPGPDLTDTMLVLSFNNVNKTMVMISVPRDIWVSALSDKINSAYHYGGLLLAKVDVEDIIGMQIQYAVVIDFSQFQRVIDEVGGIDVNVPTTFTDTQYPCETSACVYETVHFDAGRQHMDGARALIYARSRHADGAEGSDFARSKRQQLIMLALKDRLVHPLEWFTFARAFALPKVVDDATDMDMSLAQAMRIGKRFVGVKEADIQRITFEDHLSNPPEYLYNNLYVLVPQTDWNDVHSYIASQL